MGCTRGGGWFFAGVGWRIADKFVVHKGKKRSMAVALSLAHAESFRVSRLKWARGRFVAPAAVKDRDRLPKVGPFRGRR
jgi:hypothetical protein